MGVRTRVTIDDFSIGQSAQHERTITEADVLAFADITGDHNPVHVDAESAAASSFGARVVHGMLTASLISAALATHLPGPGAIYVSQTLRFLRPVKLGETVTVHLAITSIDAPKRKLVLATAVRNARGKTVLDGEATALVPAS